VMIFFFSSAFNFPPILEQYRSRFEKKFRTTFRQSFFILSSN